MTFEEIMALNSVATTALQSDEELDKIIEDLFISLNIEKTVFKDILFGHLPSDEAELSMTALYNFHRKVTAYLANKRSQDELIDYFINMQVSLVTYRELINKGRTI